MTETASITWPSLKAAYLDVFGEIAPDVYAAAGHLWPQAEKVALATLQDAAIGQQLLLKAAALVTRKQQNPETEISNLSGYLWRTYQRLILAELEKQNLHRQKETDYQQESTLLSDVREMEQKILVQQLVRRLDEETHRIFRWLCLGHNFEEIGRRLGISTASARNKYNRQIKRLMQQLAEETHQTD